MFVARNFNGETEKNHLPGLKYGRVHVVNLTLGNIKLTEAEGKDGIGTVKLCASPFGE
jgi:hypothetical protein